MKKRGEAVFWTSVLRKRTLMEDVFAQGIRLMCETMRWFSRVGVLCAARISYSQSLCISTPLYDRMSIGRGVGVRCSRSRVAGMCFARGIAMADRPPTSPGQL